jgi:hypothetical protein
MTFTFQLTAQLSEAAYPNWLFNINPGDDGKLEDLGKDGRIKNTLRFKGTGLKT